MSEVSALGGQLWVVKNPAPFEELLDAVGAGATLLCTSGLHGAAFQVHPEHGGVGKL